MINTKLSQPNSVALFGVKIDGVSIDKDGLDPRLKSQLGRSAAVMARIVAVQDETGWDLLEEPMALLVAGPGKTDGIPERLVKHFSDHGDGPPAIRRWDVDLRDETLFLEVETLSFEDALADDDGEDGGAIAIRGADGRLFVVPGQSSDYEAPAGMDGAFDQLPGASIDVIEMKDLPAGSVEGDDEVPMMRGRMVRGRMLRGRMLRGRMLRGRMLRGRMLRGRMLRGRMLRGRMLRGRIITSDHRDED